MYMLNAHCSFVSYNISFLFRFYSCSGCLSGWHHDTPGCLTPDQWERFQYSLTALKPAISIWMCVCVCPYAWWFAVCDVTLRNPESPDVTPLSSVSRFASAESACVPFALNSVWCNGFFIVCVECCVCVCTIAYAGSGTFVFVVVCGQCSIGHRNCYRAQTKHTIGIHSLKLRVRKFRLRRVYEHMRFILLHMKSWSGSMARELCGLFDLGCEVFYRREYYD